MSAMASRIAGALIVFSTVCSGTEQENIKALRHWPLWPVDTLHKGPVTRMFPFDDVIIHVIISVPVTYTLTKWVKWLFSNNNNTQQTMNHVYNCWNSCNLYCIKVILQGQRSFGNGLSIARRQPIAYTNDDLLPIGSPRTNFGTWIKLLIFSF